MKCRGVTLLELMAAISITAVIVTLVLSSWNYINRHVYHQESRGRLQNETARVAEEISGKLKRSPALISAVRNSVTFVDDLSGDTVEYAFDKDTLTKNGTPVPFLVNGGAITSFDLQDISAWHSEYMLLEITITSSDAHENRDTITSTINVKTAPNY